MPLLTKYFMHCLFCQLPWLSCAAKQWHPKSSDSLHPHLAGTWATFFSSWARSYGHHRSMNKPCLPHHTRSYWAATNHLILGLLAFWSMAPSMKQCAMLPLQSRDNCCSLHSSGDGTEICLSTNLCWYSLSYASGRRKQENIYLSDILRASFPFSWERAFINGIDRFNSLKYWPSAKICMLITGMKYLKQHHAT